MSHSICVREWRVQHDRSTGAHGVRSPHLVRGPRPAGGCRRVTSEAAVSCSLPPVRRSVHQSRSPEALLAQSRSTHHAPHQLDPWTAHPRTRYPRSAAPVTCRLDGSGTATRRHLGPASQRDPPRTACQISEGGTEEPTSRDRPLGFQLRIAGPGSPEKVCGRGDSDTSDSESGERRDGRLRATNHTVTTIIVAGAAHRWCCHPTTLRPTTRP